MANVKKINGAKGISYRIRVGNGYDADGKQISKSMNWTPVPGMTEKQIEKELQRVTIEFEKKVIDGQAFDKIKFSEFSEIWLKDYAEKQCSPKYIFDSKKMLLVINSEIGHIPLTKLRKPHLQDFYTKLANETKVIQKKSQDIQGNTVIETVTKRKSPSTILHYHRLISTILTKATQWDYISNNICLGKGIELPKQKKSQPHYLNDDDVIRIVSLLQNEQIDFKTIILLLIYTGMRIGEAMGLEWEDIDTDKCLISINKASQYIPGIGVFTKETKNVSSERVIQVVPELIDLLKQYKIWQNESRLEKGFLWKSNPEDTDQKHCDNWRTCAENGKSIYCSRISQCRDYKDVNRLFTQSNGIPMHPDTPGKWLKKFIRKHKLPTFHIHSLRHTTVSLMIMQGVPLPTIASMVGHSSVATTTKIYSHSIKTAEQIAIDAVANVINPERKIKRWHNDI